MIYVLDKLRFIEGLDVDIPNCVLYEIAQNRSIDVNESKLTSLTYRSKVYRLIESARYVTVSEPFSKDSLTEIAAFVNPSEIKWKTSELLEVFKTTWSTYWEKYPTHESITNDQQFGYPTPSQRNVITPVIAYSILIKMKVRTTYDTSLEAMAAVLLSVKRQRSKIIRDISTELPLLKTSSLLTLYQMMLSSCKYRGSKQHKTNNLSQIISDLNDKRFVGSDFVPKTSVQAIAAAIVFYSVDISSSKDPLREYACIVNKRQCHDEDMKESLKANANLYNLRYYFNPDLPYIAYDSESLKDMMTIEGLNSAKGDKATNHFRKLKFKYEHNRFHYGIIRKTIDYETIIDMYDVREHPGPKVSYGNHERGFRPYVVSELISAFSSERCFINAHSTCEAFDRGDIESLKATCKYGQVADGHPDWQRLLDVIKDLESHASDIIECSKPLVSIYERSTDIEKKSIKDLLFYVLYCGLRMRNWNGTDEWPIRGRIIVPDPDKTAELSKEYLASTLEMAQQMGKLGALVLNLPLIFIRTNTTYVVPDPERGLTIRDRINIVINNLNINACILTSSGYFIISSHHYLTALGVKLEFEARDVTLI